MSLTLLGFVFFVIFVIYQLTRSSKRGYSPKKRQEQISSSSPLLYRRQKSLFTQAERSFLGTLEMAVTNDYRVLGKVRVADVITPIKGTSKDQWWTAFNKISAKHFDYVLCEKDTLNVVAAIELDDKSHNSEKRQQRDQLLDNACASANLMLIRFPAQHQYKVQDIRTRITAALNPVATFGSPG